VGVVSDFWFGFFLGFWAGIMFIVVVCWLGALLYTFKDWLTEKLKRGLKASGKQEYTHDKS